MVKRADVEPLIIDEWLKRPAGQRTENDVLMFYGVLSSSRPDLLRFRGKRLGAVLRDLASTVQGIASGPGAYEALRSAAAAIGFPV